MEFRFQFKEFRFKRNSINQFQFDVENFVSISISIPEAQWNFAKLKISLENQKKIAFKIENNISHN